MQQWDDYTQVLWAKQADEAHAWLEGKRAKARDKARARKEAKEAARRATVGEAPLG
jgi:hypothetical protein